MIERLMLQVEHVLVANQLQIVTKEVVETARQNLIIGPDRTESLDELSRNRSFVVTKRDIAHACGASLPLYQFPILLKSC